MADQKEGDPLQDPLVRQIIMRQVLQLAEAKVELNNWGGRPSDEIVEHISDGLFIEPAAPSQSVLDVATSFDTSVRYIDATKNIATGEFTASTVKTQNLFSKFTGTLAKIRDDANSDDTGNADDALTAAQGVASVIAIVVGNTVLDVTGVLGLLKTYRDLYKRAKIDLTDLEARVVLALYDAEYGFGVKVLTDDFAKNVAEAGTEITKKDVSAAIENLRALGCVSTTGGRLKLIEKVYLRQIGD